MKKETPRKNMIPLQKKYFGRKIKNFNNSKSEIIPGTDKVCATEWSFNSSVYMILKILVEEIDGGKTTELYVLNISDAIFF